MLKKKKLKKFIRKNSRKMGQLLKAFKDAETDKEILHDLRLQHKKLRAVTRLLNGTGGKKHFSAKALAPLFKLAGQVRTAQLILQQMEQYHVRQEKIEQEQNACMQEAAISLRQQKKHFKKAIVGLEKRLLKKCYSVSNESVVQYYSQSIETLEKAFVIPIYADQLHENRKEVKNLLYALAVVPASLKKSLHINQPYLEDLQNLIGQWHDDWVLWQLLLKAGYSQAKDYQPIHKEKEELLQQVKIKAAHFGQEARRVPQPGTPVLKSRTRNGHYAKPVIWTFKRAGTD